MNKRATANTLQHPYLAKQHKPTWQVPTKATSQSDNSSNPSTPPECRPNPTAALPSSTVPSWPQRSSTASATAPPHPPTPSSPPTTSEHTQRSSQTIDATASKAPTTQPYCHTPPAAFAGPTSPGSQTRTSGVWTSSKARSTSA